MYLHPDRVDQERVVRWLEANGCRHYVALEPVVVKGSRAYYTAICRKDPRSLARIPVVRSEFVPLGRRSVRIRVPLVQF